MKVLIAQDIVPEGKNYLRERGYEVVVSPAFDAETLKQQIVGCDGVLVRFAPFTADIMAAADRLKVIARFGIGVDNIDVEEATRRGIQVTNAPRANSNAVAEHTVVAIGALSKHLLECDREMRLGNWDCRTQFVFGDLQGKTIGLLGLGQIGRLVAKKLHFGFDMNVIGYDPYAKDLPDYITLATPEEIYAQADFVSLHMPSLPETRGMINKDVFRAMKKTASFVNMARGDVVVEEDLAWALKTGEIASASVDVYIKEPPAADHPFFGAPHLILSPHSAALTVQANIAMGTHAAQGIHEVLSGQKPTWPVNRLG